VVSQTIPKTPPAEFDSGSAQISKDELFAALEAVPDGVSVVDSKFNIVFMNRRLKAAVGDLVGQKCYETELGSDDICSRCPVKTKWNYEASPYRHQGVDEHGRAYEFTVTKVIELESKEEYYISIERNVTDKTQTEHKLKTLMASFDQMADAVCVSDLDGRIIYINKAYVQLTGYEDKGVAGLSMMGVSGSGTSDATMEVILKTAADSAWRGDMTGLRKDGVRYYANVEAKPVKDLKGSPVAVVAILRDITRQKSEKIETEKYTSELESKMEARTLELARKVSQLTTINKISRVVTSILDSDELVSEFVKAIAQGFGYEHVFVMLMDKERGDLFMKAGYGSNVDALPKEFRQNLKEGIVGHAAYFGETLVCGDVDHDPRYIRKALIGTKSELAVPMTFRGELLGVLDVQRDIRDAFTRNDVNLLEMLSDMLATSITNARVYTESKEREAALSVLDRLSKQISYRLEPSVVLDQVSRDAATLLKAEKAMVGLLDKAATALSFVAPYRIEKSKVTGRVFPPTYGVTGRVLKSLKTEVVNDYRSDPNQVARDADDFGIKSMVSAPLIIEGRGIGVVNVYNKLGGQSFSKGDALFLSSLADHAAIALENANLLSTLNQRVHSQLALLETALSMQRQIDSSAIYEIVADKLREVVWYDAITFYKIDHEKQLITPIVARGPYVEEIMSESFGFDVGITGHVAKTGKPEVVSDTTKDSRAVQVAGTPMEREAMMAIPLMGKESVIGVLNMYRNGEAGFTDSEFEISQLFASQASVAVENSELYRTREFLLKESRRKVEQMAKVLELTTSVMYMGDLEKVLQRVADAVIQSFGFKRASIAILDPEGQEFTIKALSGYPEWAKDSDKRPVSDIMDELNEEFKVGRTSYYLKFEKQKFGIDAFDFLAHPELADKPRASPDAWHERDIFFSAFKSRSGRLTGYLLVDEPNNLKVPTSDDIEVLEILAGIASIAVENTRVYERQVLAANEIALLNDLMTHDINNFNQGIMGYLELLLEDRRLDDNQKKYAERALTQVKNNARLIDNVRKLTKIRMMPDSDFVQTDLHAAIEQSMEAVSKAFPGRKLAIVSTMTPGAHYVMANPYIIDLFTNVLSNAVKFDLSSRVRVDILVSDEATPQGESWVVSIADRGRGIPDDRKKVVFERFATGITGIKGFGLGLSIVSAIVERYGGRIWVEDRVQGDFGKGTVFKISIPKAQRAQAVLPKKNSHANGQTEVTSSASERTPEQPSQDRNGGAPAS